MVADGGVGLWFIPRGHDGDAVGYVDFVGVAAGSVWEGRGEELWAGPFAGKCAGSDLRGCFCVRESAGGVCSGGLPCQAWRTGADV